MTLLEKKNVPYTKSNLVGALCTKEWKLVQLVQSTDKGVGVPIGNGTMFIPAEVTEFLKSYAEDNMLRVTVYFKNPFITR